MENTTTIRVLTSQERTYVYDQSNQIKSMCGLIGVLRGDMDTDGKGFFSTWFGFRDDLKTQEFKDELDDVINNLRFGKLDADGAFVQEDQIFENRRALARYCDNQPDALMDADRKHYGFRIDTEKYAYLMKLIPLKGDYNFYIYCYVKPWLDGHLKAAKQGIRFIDSHYHDLFRIEDGGQIVLKFDDGSEHKASCRYIDEYHLEVSGHTYHICEYAERRERAGATVEPVIRWIE